jgi:hypothetical protein
MGSYEVEHIRNDICEVLGHQSFCLNLDLYNTSMF